MQNRMQISPVGGADRPARLVSMNRLPLSAREALYLFLIELVPVGLGFALAGPIGAVLAAAVTAAAGAYLRGPATRAADREVNELREQLNRATREMNDPNRPVRDMARLATHARYGSPFSSRNRPPGW
jgi:hypothetical protein